MSGGPAGPPAGTLGRRRTRVPPPDLKRSPVTPSLNPRAPHAGLAILALAIGGFAIGTTEFVTMGLLPEIAAGTGVSIPTAGHYVSAYAAGVVAGAPVLAAWTAPFPRKATLLGLMAFFALANAASGFVDDYWPLMAARFLSGIPHGAFFGLAGLAAARLVEPHRRTWAVAMVLIGLAAANVVGVPATTLLGQQAGWHAPYWVVAAIGATCVVCTALWLPPDHDGHASTMRAELRALTRVQVWLALLMGTVGFGGMFATFSYISPTMTELTGFDRSAVPFILALYGVGMVLGTLVAGRVAGAVGVLPGILGALTLVLLVLVAFGFAAQAKPTALLATVALGFFPSILVPLLQTRLMDVADDGQNLAAALNHSTLNIANAVGAWLGASATRAPATTRFTLNIANAVGAWLGGLVLSAGYGYEWPSRVGALLALGGLGFVALSWTLERRRPVRSAR